MKKVVFLFLMLLPFFGTQLDAQNTLTVTWKYANIIEGYDHDNKCKVFIDGEEVGESSVKPESALNSITVKVPARACTVKVMHYALYEGSWEEHTIANNYSLDASYEGERTFTKSAKLFMVMDIESETTTVSWKKMPKVKKAKS